MSPGNDEGRPRQESAPIVKTTDTRSVQRGTDASMRPHRFCPADVVRRRRVSAELGALLRDLYPPEPRRPSDFGLEPHELRRHANVLRRAGWSAAEVAEVLEREP